MGEFRASVSQCVSRALLLLKSDGDVSAARRSPPPPPRARTAIGSSGAGGAANASGVCAYAATPAAALHGVALLLDAAAPHADSDAQHALVAVVVAALLDTEQRVDAAFVGAVRQLIDTQLLGRAQLQAALCDASTPLLSFERLVLLARARVLDAAAYAAASFAAPLRATVLRDRLVHACIASSGAGTLGAAFVALLLESEARLALLEQLLVADVLADDDDNLLRFAAFVLARVRHDADDFAVRLLERLLARRQASAPAGFGREQLSPLVSTCATLAAHRELFIGLCDALGMATVIDVVFRVVTTSTDTVRWSVLLPLLRCVVGSPEASDGAASALNRVVDAAVESNDQRLMHCCVVTARALESTLEHATSFPAFGEWLAAATRGVAKRARFIVHCLTALVPNEAPAYLKVQMPLVSEWARDLAPAYSDLAAARRGDGSGRDVTAAANELFGAASDASVLERVGTWRLLQAGWFEAQFVPHLLSQTTWLGGASGRARADEIVRVLCGAGVISRTAPLFGAPASSPQLALFAALAPVVAAVCADAAVPGALQSALLSTSRGADVGTALLVCVCVVPPMAVASAAELVPALVRVCAAVDALGEASTTAVSRAIERVLCASAQPAPAALWGSDFALQACALLARRLPCFGGVTAALSRTTVACTADALWFVRRCAAVWDAATAMSGARVAVPGRVALLLSWLGARLKAPTGAVGQLFAVQRLCTATRLAAKLRRPLPLRSVVEFELALVDDDMLGVHERAVWLRLGVAHALVREFGGDRALLCQALLDSLARHDGAAHTSAYALILSVLQQHAAAVPGVWALAVLRWHDRSDAAALHRCIDALLLLPTTVLLGTAPSAAELRAFARWLCRGRALDVVLTRRDWSAHVANALLVQHARQPDAVRALVRWAPLCARLAADWARVHSAVLIDDGAAKLFADVDAIATLLAATANHASPAWSQLAADVVRHAPAAAGAALGLNALEPAAVPLDAVAATLRAAPPAAAAAFCYALAAAYSAGPARHHAARAALALFPAAAKQVQQRFPAVAKIIK